MTEHMHNQIADAEREMKRIQDDAAALLRAVQVCVDAFAVKYPNAEYGDLTRDFSARLDDIVDDLEGPAYRRKIRLEDDTVDCVADALS